MTIQTYYAKLPNMGDLLNEWIIPNITSQEITHCPNCFQFDIMGIGSFASSIFTNRSNHPQKMMKNMAKEIIGAFSTKPCAVWGTGFFSDRDGQQLHLVRKNVSFIALRGKLTMLIMEKAGCKFDAPPVLCDGGILTANCFHEQVKKQYRVGFIPHYKEMDLCSDKGLLEAMEKRNDAIVINLKDDPKLVIQQIAQCETVISSSLHGCIVADSFHIPNVRVQLSDIPGTGFKFDDYYSGFGLNNPAIHIDKAVDFPSEHRIIDEYQLSDSMIETKKRQMADCLKKYVAEHL